MELSQHRYSTMLKLRDPKNRHGAVWLVEPGVTVGRRSGNHLVINRPDVADCQFEIRVKGEQFILRNCAPDYPLSVNGQPVADGYVLRERDLIGFGAVELQLVDPKKFASSLGDSRTTWALKANSAALGGRVYPLRSPTLVGRSSECDISLAIAHLSRRHARLHVQNGLLYVKDLGSANGTYLNGVRVSEARVRRGDELSFDALSFGVIGPLDDLNRTSIRMSPSKASPAPSLHSYQKTVTAVNPRTQNSTRNRTGPSPSSVRPASQAREVVGPGRGATGTGKLWLTVVLLFLVSGALVYHYGR